MLKIADGLSLPLEAVTETFGILARRGAGKTYTAAVLTEELVKADAPVVVLDPVGAWWGLRASSDGKSAGLPVVILGGEHGDAPLETTGGKVIADLVVDDPRPLILDLSAFESNGAQDRFVADFAEHLYRRKAQKREPLHIVFDEADSFAPQRPQPGQMRMLGAIEALVRRGRQRGLGATFITQRPAVLNKNVLTQIEVLIVLQITAPQDRAAIEDWVRGNGTPEQSAELLKSLASLQRGQAWFWSPSRFDLFQKVQVRRRETFDSSKTPEVGEKLVHPQALAPVDLALLRERLAATLERAKNDDPALLRRQIADLQRQMKERPQNEFHPNAPAKIVEKIIEKTVEIPVFQPGEIERLEKTAADMAADIAALGEGLLTHAAQICACLKRTHQAGREVKPAEKLTDVPPPKTPPPAFNATSGGNLTRVQSKILAVLAHYPQGRNKKQIALMAGYAIGGGSFGAALGDLKARNLIAGTTSGYTITPEGAGEISPVEPLPTGQKLLALWVGQLNKCEGAILEHLARCHPRSLARDEIAAATGYEAKGGSFGAAISKLRSLELVQGSRELRADETLVETAAIKR